MIKQYKVVWSYWKGQRVELIEDASWEREKKKYNSGLTKIGHNRLKQKKKKIWYLVKEN